MSARGDIKCLNCGNTQVEVHRSYERKSGAIKCTKAKHRYVTQVDGAVSRWVDLVRSGLANGLSTEEIAADVGVKYQSMIQSLRRCGFREEHTSVLRLRMLEFERADRPEWHDRQRCIHGSWTSSGECEHGKMGRYAKEAA